MIWRRLLVSSEATIAQLHQYIQVAFNWSVKHWHRFRIHGKDHGIAYLSGIRFDDNPHAVRLPRFYLDPRESFRQTGVALRISPLVFYHINLLGGMPSPFRMRCNEKSCGLSEARRTL